MPSRPTRPLRKEPTADEVLTIKEVAALLKVAEKMVYAGELPAFKIRDPWRIRRMEFERWMDEQPRGGRDGDA